MDGTNQPQVLSEFNVLLSISTKGGHVHIPAVLTPAIGIKVRSSGQAVKLETIKRSRYP